MLLLPEMNFLHLILPVALLLVGGWVTPHAFPGPTHSRGGLMGYDHDNGRGDPEPATCIHVLFFTIFQEIQRLWCLHWHSLPCQTTHVLPHSKRQLLKCLGILKSWSKTGPRKRFLSREDPPVLGLTARFRFTICLSKQICQLDGLE